MKTSEKAIIAAVVIAAGFYAYDLFSSMESTKPATASNNITVIPNAELVPLNTYSHKAKDPTVIFTKDDFILAKKQKELMLEYFNAKIAKEKATVSKISQDTRMKDAEIQLRLAESEVTLQTDYPTAETSFTTSTEKPAQANVIVNSILDANTAIMTVNGRTLTATTGSTINGITIIKIKPSASTVMYKNNGVTHAALMNRNTVRQQMEVKPLITSDGGE